MKGGEDQLEAGSDVADGKLPHVTSGIDVIQTEVVDLQRKTTEEKQ